MNTRAEQKKKRPVGAASEINLAINLLLHKLRSASICELDKVNSLVQPPNSMTCGKLVSVIVFTNLPFISLSLYIRVQQFSIARANRYFILRRIGINANEIILFGAYAYNK